MKKTTITKAWLDKHAACTEGRQWLEEQDERDSIKVLKKLQAEKKWDWFNWTASRLMTHKQRVLWACDCAELVLEIFEKKHPDDKRPRLAIDAAKKWAKNPTKKNKDAAAAANAAANAAAYAAYAAAAYAAYAAAYAAAAAANAAAYAAYAAAAYAAYAAAANAAAAAYAAYAAAANAAADAYAANAAANAAAYAAADAAAYAAREEMRNKCAELAFKILEGK